MPPSNIHTIIPPCGDNDLETVVRLLTIMIERQDALMERQEALDDKLDGHMGREEGMLTTFAKALPTKEDGSPDVEGHRSYHTALIEEARTRAQMYRELRSELMRKGLWGLITVIGFLIAYWWQGQMGGRP